MTPEWDEAFAERLVGRVVQRLKFRFKNYADWYDKDCLMAAGLDEARKAWHAGKYNPAKGAKSTFIYTVAWRYLHSTLLRTISRQRRLEVPGLKSSDAYRATEDPALIEWAIGIYKRSNDFLKERGITVPEKPRGRPTTYSDAHVLTLYALKERQKLSQRQAVELLVSNSELRDAIELPSAPASNFFTRKANTSRIARYYRPAT